MASNTPTPAVANERGVNQAQRFCSQPAESSEVATNRFFDQSFRFQLCAQRNPKPLWRIGLGGQFVCDSNDRTEICQEILARGARGKMILRGWRKRRKSLLLDYVCKFFTLHKSTPEGRELAGQPSLKKRY